MRDALAQQRARALRVRLTEAERHLWQRLRRKQLAGHRFRRQVPVGGYIADFVCLEAQLVIELDGGQHQQQSAYDERRDRAIAEQGFRVLRFWNDQVFRETDAVLSVILAALEEVK
jgi:very-short-patch-repair endonuclease